MKLSATMIALAALTLSAPGAIAQSPGNSQTAANSGGLLRQDYITSTGQTVPHPGESQSSGPSKLDHSLNRENDRIEHSICKGC